MNKKYTLVIITMLFVQIAFAQAPAVTSFFPASGGFYSQITIKGLSFTGATAVSFGGIPANYFFVLNDTTIISYVDTGATGKVSITTPAGTGTKAGFTFVLPPKIYSFTPASGGNGTSITIKGLNLTGATAVYFGNTRATSFTVLSDTVIAAIVANGSSGAVTVYTQGGSASLPGFTHTAPIITAFTPTAGTVGTSIKISGTNFTGATAVSIGGVPAASFTVVSSTTINATVGTGIISSDTISVTTPQGIGMIKGFDIPVVSNFWPDYASSGTLISIIGFNFTGASAVKFGNTQAISFTVKSDSLIEAVVGKNSSGQVTITTPLGTATSMYYFHLDETPKLTSYFPTTAVSGTAITFVGRNLSNVTNVTFGGVSAASISVISDDTVIAVVGAGASGYVIVYNPFGSVYSSTDFTFSTSPQIFSFAPESGPVGTIVKITGINFSPGATNNTVYFGAVKAIVSSATDRAITVIAPAGASYQDISVITDSFVVQTAKPFINTFKTDTASIVPILFSAIKDYASEDNTPYDIVSADMDNDGKPELLVVNYKTHSVTVYKNTTSNGVVSFVRALYVPSVLQVKGIVAGDFNGDGKLDFAVAGGNGVEVFKNNSTNGTFLFNSIGVYSTGTGYADIATADFDGDGKLDLVATSQDTWADTYVLHNTTVDDVISFQALLSNDAGHPNNVAVADMDGDGKKDIVVANGTDAEYTASMITIYKNTSSAGNISFDPVWIYSSRTLDGIAVADFDGDGKIDIATISSLGNTVSVLKNNCVNGVIAYNSFDSSYTYSTGATGNYPMGISVADLNGDGKPDIVACLIKKDKTSLLQNTSSNGKISFAPSVDYGKAWGNAITTGDLDMDGKPDIAVVNFNTSTFSILINKTGLNTASVCASSNTFFTTALTGSNYQWQINAGDTGFTDLTNNANYTGVNTDTLQLTNISSSLYASQYRCKVDGVNSEVYALKFVDTWTGAVDSSWANASNWSCGAVPDANTDVIIDTANPVAIASNITIRSLLLNPNSSLTIKVPYMLTIIH